MFEGGDHEEEEMPTTRNLIQIKPQNCITIETSVKKEIQRKYLRDFDVQDKID